MLFIAACGVLLPVSEASAHTDLVSTVPAAGAVLDTAPANVVLTFNEDLLAASAEASILDASGRLISTTEATVAGSIVTIPWPADLGATYEPQHFENKPYWNLGCATQRNLAAMVDNPADLVQPRGESPTYTPRRTAVIDKYRQGQGPATVYSNGNQGMISEVGR